VSRFDRVLIDPPAADLQTALEAAWRAAASRPSTAPERAPWAVLLGRLDAEPEGQHVGRVSTERHGDFAVAWWRDFLGRRHVRVRGRQGSPAWPFEAPPAALPAVYPERTLTHLGEPGVRVIVLCRCGAWGDPAALGWMGDACGPCHDRRAAGQTPPHAWPLATPGSAKAVAVEPGGWAVAALHEDRTVSIRDLRTGHRTADLAVGMARGTLRLSPGGRYLAVCRDDGDRGAIVLWDVASGQELVRLGHSRPLFALAADGTIFGLGGHVCRPPFDRGWEDFAQGWVSSFALSPAGDRVAVVGPERTTARLLDAATGEEVLRRSLSAPPRSAPAFAADGRVFLVLETAPRPRPWALFEVVADRLVGQGHWPGAGWAPDATLEVSPDGRALASGLRDELRVWPLPDEAGHTPFAGAFAATDTASHAWLPDGRLLRFDGRSGRVSLWPAEVFRP
jgi:hypothetical protein